MRKSGAKVVVAGSFNADITARTPRFPVGGETVLGSGFIIDPGGKGSNQAVAARKSGAETVMIARTGTDFLSEMAFELYKETGICTDFVFRTPNVSTGAAFIEVSEENGENRIIVISGANAKLSAEDIAVAEKDISGCGVVLTQLETPCESAAELFRLAAKHKRTTVLNPAPFRDVPVNLWSFADYITPNEIEAEYFTGVKVADGYSASEAAKVFLEKGVKNVIITLGNNGSFFSDGVNEYRIPAVKAGTVVDTTGAGDCFTGAFCAALAEGRTVRESMLFASCAAGISVTRKGASASMPSRDETDALLNNYGKA